MAQSAAPIETEEDVTLKPEERARPCHDPKNRPRTQPPYAVILHNDHVNGFDHVGSLRKVFGYGRIKAFRLTLQAHVSGRALVWSGMREHAELKAEQLTSCGPDPVMRASGANALSVSIEPLPG